MMFRSKNKIGRPPKNQQLKVRLKHKSIFNLKIFEQQYNTLTVANANKLKRAHMKEQKQLVTYFHHMIRQTTQQGNPCKRNFASAR